MDRATACNGCEIAKNWGAGCVYDWKYSLFSIWRIDWGACLGAGQLSLVHHDPWHSNREAVLQNGQAVSNALWGIGRVKLVCGSSHTAFF